MQLANAPVSYGVFGLARPDRVPLPTGDELLHAVKAAGYDGIDLGEHGLLGVGDELVANLARNGLGLCGGWLDYPFTAGDAEFDAALERSRPVLDDFAFVASAQSGLAPLPTIADSGSPERAARPGQHHDIDDATWATLARRVERVATDVRARGLEPTFHHHAATHIESPDEIDRLLADTSIGLTFDTGHLILGGGDPIADHARWADRINHIHLKDVRLAVLRDARSSADLVRDVWQKRVFAALGDGDLDVPAMVGTIVGSGFDGWIVVEQDVVLMDADDVERAIADQVANRELLREWFA